MIFSFSPGLTPQFKSIMYIKEILNAKMGIIRGNFELCYYEIKNYHYKIEKISDTHASLPENEYSNHCVKSVLGFLIVFPIDLYITTSIFVISKIHCNEEFHLSNASLFLDYRGILKILTDIYHGPFYQDSVKSV